MVALLNFLTNIYPIPSEASEAIIRISSIHTLKKGKVLQPIGHTCRTIYFMQTGIARIFYFKDDIDITEYFAFENNIIARVESLFSGRPSRKGIEIIEDAEVISINATHLFGLYDQYPEIERLFRKITESGYVETVNRLESIQFHTAEERYKALLEAHPEIIQRVPLKYIASYLGITQVSLSRIRSTSVRWLFIIC